MFRSILSSIILLILILSGCSNESEQKELISNASMLNSSEYRIGVPDGTAAMFLVEEKYKDSELVYFNSLADGYAAVEFGKIDAFAFDQHAMMYLEHTNKALALMDDKLGEVKIVVGISKKRPELEEPINKFIAQYRVDGTYKNMRERWITGVDLKMPDIPQAQTPTRTLVVGTEGLSMPVSFVGDNGELVGFDIEFIKRLGLFLNAKVELKSMPYGALINSLASGKIDLLISGLNATPERAKQAIMSDVYVDSSIALLVRKDRLPEKKLSALDLDYYNNKNFAMVAGTIFNTFIDKRLKGATYSEFMDNVSGVEALLNKKVDALAIDEPASYEFLRLHPEIISIKEYIAEDSYGVMVAKNSPLRKKLNDFIKELEKSGELKKMKKYWVEEGNKVNFPECEISKGYDGSAGTISVGTDPMLPGFTFVANNQVMGYDIDLIRRFAYRENLTMKVGIQPFSSLMTGVQAGKIDIAVACISITEERRKKVDFSEPYINAGVVILVLKPVGESSFKYSDFNDFVVNSRASAMTGSYGEMLLQSKYKCQSVSSFDSFADCVPSILNRKYDYIIGSYTSLLIYAKANEHLEVLPEPLSDDGNAIAFPKENTALRDKVNVVLDKFKKDGTLKDLEERWINNLDYRVQKVSFDSSWPVLNVAIAADREPICFVQDGQYVGFDCELIERIAHELKMQIKYHNMKFGSMLPAMQSGKVDLVISNVTKTAERAKKVGFSDVYFNNPQRLLVHRDVFNALHPELVTEEKHEQKSSWMDSFKSSFKSTFLVEDRYKLVWSGLKVTIIISVCSLFLGTIWGFLVCLMRRSSHKFLNVPAMIYIRIVQGMPIVVILMILYYIVFGSIDIDAIIVAIVGFALSFSAYSSEMMRTGIDAVDKGQIEAAQAMGFGRFKIFMKIVFPQAARHTLPVYKGEFIATVKSTAIVGYIAIQDLTKVSDIIRSRTYEAFFPLIVTAIIYFLVAYMFTFLLSIIEWRIDPKCRKRVVKGVVVK